MRRFTICIFLPVLLLFITHISYAQDKAGSIIKESDIFQVSQVPKKASGFTRIEIAANLLVDIKGYFPENYKPYWSHVANQHNTTLNCENHVGAKVRTTTEGAILGINEHAGKAVLVFNNSYAEIEIHDKAVITSTPQIFTLGEFKKMAGREYTDEKGVGSSNMYTAGGRRGQIRLSSNEQGDIAIGLILEIFSTGNRFREPGISYRYSIENLVCTNNNVQASRLATPSIDESLPKTLAPLTAADNKYIRMLKLREQGVVKACVAVYGSIKETSNYRIIRRDAKGIPEIIRFDFTTGSYIGGKWTSLNTSYIDVLYKEGLPYAVYPNDYRIEVRFPLSYDSKEEISKTPAEAFTTEEESRIKKFYAAFKSDQLSNSDSYKAVMNKLASIPAKYDFKNKLGIVYVLRDQYKFEWIPAPPPTQALPVNVGTFDYQYDGKFSKKSLKNISKDTIIIGGIEKSRTRNGYVYSYQSITVPPGRLFEYIDIKRQYDPTVELGNFQGNLQFVGNTGNMSDLMVAKRINGNTLEVDSYTNSTDIKVKKGDGITIKATGKIRFGLFAGDADAKGMPGYEEYSSTKGIPHGALIARVGNGDWMYVGTLKTFTAPASGILQLAVNDADPENNYGVFVVEYVINKN